MAHKNRDNVSPMKSRQGQRHRRPQQVYSLNEANDRLQDLFRNHELQVSHVERMQLAKFYVLLMENQEKENFTRLLTLRDVAVKHFIDCLWVLQLTELQGPLMDLGTGPGFPGIPLKICRPDLHIVLAEGVQRRVEFLKHLREQMQLSKLDIIGRNVNPYFAYPVRGVITRAVEDIRNTLSNVLTCLQTGGRVYFMKGPNVDPEIALVRSADFPAAEYYKLVQDTAYTLPHTPHHRRLVIYEKIKASPLIDFDEEPWPED